MNENLPEVTYSEARVESLKAEVGRWKNKAVAEATVYAEARAENKRLRETDAWEEVARQGIEIAQLEDENERLRAKLELYQVGTGEYVRELLVRGDQAVRCLLDAAEAGYLGTYRLSASLRDALLVLALLGQLPQPLVLALADRPAEEKE